MINIQPYQQTLSSEWDRFISASRNGTFLLERRYMDYHRDRFEDASWLFYENNTLQAILPANKSEQSLVSHGGLTFGGLVLNHKIGASFVKTALETLAETLAKAGYQKLIYKPVPHIYHQVPSEEDLYVLYQMGAVTTRVDLSTTIKQSNLIKLAKGRKCALSKARKAGVEVKRSEDFATFWHLLESNLHDKHDTKPTHTLEEITKLAIACPEIKLYLAYVENEAVAGVVMYDYAEVAHTQYIASNAVSRETGALDALIVYLFQEVYQSKTYFNFGISTCQNGQYFNEGLAAQKEMFGGRTTILQWMELSL